MRENEMKSNHQCIIQRYNKPASICLHLQASEVVCRCHAIHKTLEKMSRRWAELRWATSSRIRMQQNFQCYINQKHCKHCGQSINQKQNYTRRSFIIIKFKWKFKILRQWATSHSSITTKHWIGKNIYFYFFKYQIRKKRTQTTKF